MNSKNLCIIALYLLLSSMAFAQSSAGRVTGTIADSTGGVIPGAQVRLISVDTGVERAVSSNEQGYYNFPLVPAGVYRIVVSREGFQTVNRTGVTIEVEQVANVDFNLNVGVVSETVEVRETTPLLQASTSSLGQVVESQQIMDLPLNTRTALGLLGLSAGVTVGRGFDANTFNNANLFSAGGSRPGQNEFLLDGAPNTLPGVWAGRGILGVTVPVDSIQEFKVQTNAFSAEYGRSGGGLVNTVSKSGTNSFHGSLYNFLRNSKLDANNFFANRNNVPLGSFKRNQFGGTIGGPIHRNHTFFFVNYQATRARTAANSTFTVPAAEMRTGDFSQLTAGNQRVTIYDPLTTQTVGNNPIRQPFAGNIIPANRINAVSRNIVGKYPAPNQPTSLNNLVLNASQARTNDILGVRVDHTLTSRQQLNGRFYYTRDDDVNPNWYGNETTPGNLGLLQDVYSVAADYVFTVSPTMLLNTRYAYNQRTHKNLSRSLGIDLTTLGFPSALQSQNGETTYPSFNIGGYGNQGWADGINAFDYITHSIQQSATKVHGSHVIKFGGDIRYSAVPQDRGISLSGSYSFTPGFTQGPNANQGGATAGDSIASLLLGTPASGDFGTFLQVKGANTYSGLYVQDDWRVTQKLTLNLGLRYELEVPRTEKLDRLDWFDYDVVSPLNDQVRGLGELRGGMRFAAVGGNPRRHFNTDKNNFAPRIGFAYQVGTKTVLRGGYGFFYGSGSVGAAGWNIASQGFAPSTSFVGSLDGLRPIATLSNPFPDGFSQPVGNSEGLLSLTGQNVARIFDRDAPLPYNQQWNFSLQRQIGSFLVEGAYLGSRGVHLGDGAGFQINQLRPETLALGTALQTLVPNPFFGVITAPGTLNRSTVARGQLLRPYPHFGNLTVFNPAAGGSTYHGFTAKVERRFARGLGFLLSYTNSKNISDAPATIGPLAQHQDAYDRRSDRSLVEEDIAQRIVGSVSWQLPFGNGQRYGSAWNRGLDLVLGGWQLNSLFSLQSGPPLALTNTPNTSRALGGSQRPNSTGTSAARSGRVQDRLNDFLNTSVFTAPVPFTYGNVGRTLPDVRGPRMSNVDLSIFKMFPIREQVRLHLRAEFFNAFNSPMFGLPNSAFGNRAFGTITGTMNDPRQVQLALRLTF